MIFNFCLVDWNMIGALGEWAGALATVLAIGVALYFSRLSTVPRIRIITAFFPENIKIHSVGEYYIRVFNSGMVDIFIRNVLIRPKNSKTSFSIK